MDHEAERQSTVRYTIMPDYGGAYGWINREGTDALGPNHADTCGWGGDHPISDELQADFAAWQTEFERATNEWEAGIALLDWPRFHERGIALARRLKAELGDAVRIYYEKPVEDPNQRINERVEILADPARFVRLLNQAVITTQTPTYGMPDKCPVQGDILPSDDPIDIVVANRMIRVCCGRCARVVRARPYQYLGMVEYANRQRAIGERP